MNEKCFGLKKNQVCSVTVERVCHGNYATCPFYKPKWKSDQDRRQALNRIARKSAEEQRAIADKYFDGLMPWLEGNR